MCNFILRLISFSLHRQYTLWEWAVLQGLLLQIRAAKGAQTGHLQTNLTQRNVRSVIDVSAHTMR